MCGHENGLAEVCTQVHARRVLQLRLRSHLGFRKEVVADTILLVSSTSIQENQKDSRPEGWH